VLQPSPLKKSRSEIMKEERFLKNMEWSLNHFLGLNGTNVGMVTFLIPWSGSCLLSARSYKQKQASRWTPVLGKRMKGKHSNSLAKSQEQGSTITKASMSALSQGNGHNSCLKSQWMDWG
jgi:hypothetical protein